MSWQLSKIGVGIHKYPVIGHVPLNRSAPLPSFDPDIDAQGNLPMHNTRLT